MVGGEAAIAPPPPPLTRPLGQLSRGAARTTAATIASAHRSTRATQSTRPGARAEHYAGRTSASPARAGPVMTLRVKPVHA